MQKDNTKRNLHGCRGAGWTEAPPHERRNVGGGAAEEDRMRSSVGHAELAMPMGHPEDGQQADTHRSEKLIQV